MTVRIEPIPTGAGAALSSMHAACFPDEPWDAAAIDRLLALPGSLGWTAWRGEEPVGFMLARDLGDEGEILSIGVLPEMRRQGIARALLEGLTAEAERRRLGSLVLEVAADNPAARALYEGFGFRAMGHRRAYYRRAGGTADALVLRLVLTSR